MIDNRDLVGRCNEVNVYVGHKYKIITDNNALVHIMETRKL